MCDRSVLDVEQPMHRRGSVVTPTITGIVCHSLPSDEVKKTTCATRLKNKPYALIESAVRSDRTSLRLTRGLGEGTHRSRRRKWRARWGRRGGRRTGSPGRRSRARPGLGSRRPTRGSRAATARSRPPWETPPS
jgi:hypothetical protein